MSSFGPLQRILSRTSSVAIFRASMVRALVPLVMVSALMGPGLFLGCGPSTPAATPGTLQYTAEARQAYRQAMRHFKDREWESAKQAFERIRNDYSQSSYARWAELRLADILLEQEEFASAVGAFKAYMQSHRLDAAAPYAHFRVCEGLYSQISDSVMLPAQEERDQNVLEDTYAELLKFQQEYPESRWNDRVSFMLLDVTGRLARYELYVARYYLRRDNFVAAAARARYALTKYENSGLEPEALVLLGETYLKMKKRELAKKSFEQVIEVYPGSPFVAPARKFLDQIASM